MFYTGCILNQASLNEVGIKKNLLKYLFIVSAATLGVKVLSLYSFVSFFLYYFLIKFSICKAVGVKIKRSFSFFVLLLNWFLLSEREEGSGWAECYWVFLTENVQQQPGLETQIDLVLVG